MTLARLLSLGGGITMCQGRANPFRKAELGPLPFLMSTKPVDFAPVRPMLGDGAATPHRPRPKGWASKIEIGVVKTLGALFLLAVLVCGFGAQHIAYRREKNSLGRQLRQRELELRTVVQACQSLEAEKAVLVAQMPPQTGVNLAKVGATQRPAVGTVAQSASGRERKSALLKASIGVNAIRRTQLADARSHAHRGGVRG